ncbi:uncharacterized protein LOC134829041 [Culicoides brevitarsis]|uniref:uncharacterized protein LOC134829041 n=1 Tax=Culicoides brevitarsis TaxID=469753 RepID=UPI00307B9458
MSKSKPGTSKEPPKEKPFPIPLVEQYTNNCERLKKYESAVLKRFAPKISEIHDEFIRLTYVFDENFLPEYAALAYMGAARCEKVQDRVIVERHYLIKAAEAFLKAYQRRFDLGYNDGEEEYRQGALRCYNDILENPKLPKDSVIRAMVIRQLKTIDPETSQTSTFDSPFMRYEDLKRAAIYDISQEFYKPALNKLTDITDDIVERKKELFHPEMMEYSEITRLLLLLYLELPPAALAPSNVALLERYRYGVEVSPLVRAKESALDPELFMILRGFVQGIQMHILEFIRETFNELGRMPHLTEEQHKLLRLVFYHHFQEFSIEEADKKCPCPKFYPESESEEEENEEKPQEKPEEEPESSDSEELSPELEALAKDLDEIEHRHRTFTDFQWYCLQQEADENDSEEVRRWIKPTDEPRETNLEKALEKANRKCEAQASGSDEKAWIDPLTEAVEALSTKNDENEPLSVIKQLKTTQTMSAPPYPDDKGFQAPPYPPAGAPYPSDGPPPMGFSAPGMYPSAPYPNPGGYPAPNAPYPPPQQQPGYPPAPQPGYAPPQPQGFYPPPQGYAPPPVIDQQPMYPQPGMQPGMPPGSQWMQLPEHQVLIPDCPPGLEYLTTVSSLFVKQKIELLEAFVGFETNNRYTIMNNQGLKVFWAVEENDCCTRNCCGPSRSFEMKIKDAQDREIIHLSRPLRCDSCFCPCFLQVMEVSAPPGNIIGTVEQNWSIFGPQFSIKNQTGDTVMKIEGPCLTTSCCFNDVKFKLMTLDGQKVGKISKKWSGIGREMFTDSDFFGISFPLDLDVRMKAVMLGACFLIDYMFFEKRGNKEEDRPGML